MISTYHVSSSPEEQTADERLLDAVRKFWAIEEVPKAIRRSSSDVECEEIYARHVRRDSNGRYIVPLPVKTGGLTLLGGSLQGTQQALRNMQRRMQNDDKLREEYGRYMNEYISLGHMRLLSKKEQDDYPTPNYIPHHGIWQRGDEGQKLRVVFNASRLTSSGFSLNDILHSGPKLQGNLVSVITRWRQHRIAFCADIKMMFRQIWIEPQDTNLQRIFWSQSLNDNPEHYALQTVTYGESCAPYLALRTLNQLCIDEGSHYPEAVESVKRDLYMDDFLTGANDLLTAQRKKNQLVQLLKAGGFTLKKWVTNDPRLLHEIDADDRLRPNWFHFSQDGPVSELGMAWDPVRDCFRFNDPHFESSHVTKRIALAEIARVFDPVGWLAPIVVKAKIVIQDFWRAKLNWDEPITNKVMTREWSAVRNDLSRISELPIPRWIGTAQTGNLELHAFADASRRAMAAVIYSKVVQDNGETMVSLIWAKTKLAPIKSLVPPTCHCPRMTIPRLELRAALMAAQLLHSTAASLDVPLRACHAWSDSRIVLHWLNLDGSTGNDLVDNYVSHIQEVAPEVIWQHVPSKSNPADIASRGTDIRAELWWSGPNWLLDSGKPPPDDSIGAHVDTSANLEVSCCCNVVQADCHDTYLTERFSCLNKLLRISARCRRLISLLMKKETPPILDPISTAQREREFLAHALLSQRKDFGPEIERLQRGQPVSSSSVLRSLDPFLDSNGALRIRGRLGYSSLPEDEKHPLVLHGRSHLAELIIHWAHLRSLHGGFRLTYSHAAQRAWIIGGRARVRKYLRKCIVCAKTCARRMSQSMAPLPAVRVTPSRPFSKCGLDYTGPFQVLRSKGRGTRSFKGYIVLFICLATKTIHLELAGDLTTESFWGHCLALLADVDGQLKSGATMTLTSVTLALNFIVFFALRN